VHAWLTVSFLKLLHERVRLSKLLPQHELELEGRNRTRQQIWQPIGGMVAIGGGGYMTENLISIHENGEKLG
jgi:hypothetical protein